MNRYANVDDIFNHIDNDGLLVGNNAEWAKEAVCNSSYIDIDYYIPCSAVEKLMQSCKEKVSECNESGADISALCYLEFIDMLQSLWQDPEQPSTPELNVDDIVDTIKGEGIIVHKTERGNNKFWYHVQLNNGQGLYMFDSHEIWKKETID